MTDTDSRQQAIDRILAWANCPSDNLVVIHKIAEDLKMALSAPAAAVAPPLVWAECLGGWAAWSDQLSVGHVLVRNDGSIWFDANLAVHMKWIAKNNHGVVPTIEAGKKRVEKAWATWLQMAGLVK